MALNHSWFSPQAKIPAQPKHVGVEYLVSDEKREFDLTLISALRFAPVLAKLGAKATFGYELYSDDRVGQGGDIHSTLKIKTLNDVTGSPINRVARVFRALGLDELVQIDEITEGTLSTIGRRRLQIHEYDMMRDIAGATNNGRSLLAEWDETVLPYPCGLLSSYGLEGRQHGSESVERRLELDVSDSKNASRQHDTMLIKQAALQALLGKMRYSSLPIKD